MPLDVLQSCSAQSSEVGEPLSGTAIADVDVWLLLEHPGKWEADIAQTELPDATRAWLDAATARLPRARTLFIRRDRPARRLSFFVVISAPERAVYRFQVGSHDELAALDLDAVLARGLPAVEEQGGERGRPLYLVCTHGKRDACCARKGVAFLRALEEVEIDGEVWHSSHQGGHRFAATMLYLPRGIHYGRLEPSDAAPLALAHLSGRVYDLARYRGVTTLATAHQAAESWLREELAECHLDAFEHLNAGEVDEKHQFARFRSRDLVVHEVVVTSRPAKGKRLVSCNAEAPAPFATYEVVRYLART